MSDPTSALPCLPHVNKRTLLIGWRVGRWRRFGSAGEPADTEGGGREGQDPKGPEHFDGPAEQDQREPREKGPG